MNPLAHLRRLGAVIAVTVMAATGCLALLTGPAADAASERSPARQRVADSGTVPGPGWYLTLVDRGHTNRDGWLVARRSTLEAISPAGSRTVVRTWSTQRQTFDYQLVSWSVDGATALVQRTRFDNGRTVALVVDVATGAVAKVRTGGAASLELNQAGTAVVALGYATEDADNYPIRRYDLDGHMKLLRTRTGTGILPGPDDTLVTGPTSGGGRIRVLDARSGKVLHRAATPGRRCSPLRWWDDARVLAACSGSGGEDPRLALVNPTTGALRLLTGRHPARSGDYGDIDARRIRQGLFLQASGGCGYTFIARSLSHGHIRKVAVRHAVGNVLMIGTAGDRLVVQHAASCDGEAPRSVIARLNPATGREKVLVRLAQNEQFRSPLAFGETGTYWL